jgi:hypothetical protein
VPADVPETIPVDVPIAATVALLLLHVPPMAALLSVAVAPAHIDDVPEIAGGTALTLNVIVLKQPAASVYEITTVPADRPVTTPVDEPMVPTVTLLLLHVPPLAELLSVAITPIHMVDGPEIIGGGLTIVTVIVLLQPPVRI